MFGDGCFIVSKNTQILNFGKMVKLQQIAPQILEILLFFFVFDSTQTDRSGKKKIVVESWKFKAIISKQVIYNFGGRLFYKFCVGSHG